LIQNQKKSHDHPTPPPPTPTEGIEISWGEGSSLRLKNVKKWMQLNWNFQRGGEVLGKIPSVGEVWILLGTTQFIQRVDIFHQFRHVLVLNAKY